METKLYRSKDDSKIAGICSGIAKYFNVDPIIIRLIFLTILFMGPGLLIYLIAWFILPIEEK